MLVNYCILHILYEEFVKVDVSVKIDRLFFSSSRAM